MITTNDYRLIIKIPISKKRKWYQFWKKNSNENQIKSLISEYSEEIKFTENGELDRKV